MDHLIKIIENNQIEFIEFDNTKSIYFCWHHVKLPLKKNDKNDERKIRTWKKCTFKEAINSYEKKRKILIWVRRKLS